MFCFTVNKYILVIMTSNPLFQKSHDNRPKTGAPQREYAMIQYSKSIAQSIPASETLLTYNSASFNRDDVNVFSYDDTNTITLLKAGTYKVTRQDLFRVTIASGQQDIRFTAFCTSTATISSIRHGNFEVELNYGVGTHTVANTSSFILNTTGETTLTTTVSHSSGSATIDYAGNIGSQRAFLSIEFVGL